ncbi:hypothetical protein [Mycobacterium sp. URHB0044]|uniref:hypothetical protein n=1 Tax=Mycobacterium sp. URHB0044 TaxID=1380386 RepID=UPI00055E3171|nr:hypothetical protein [Mycobacterium sp. URHB0044]
MATTTDVVHNWRATYRRRGYFFREAAMLTIVIGFGMHLYRVIFGDDLTLQYAVTPTTDVLLMMPMTYASISGILSYRRMVFVNRPHRIVITASLAYISLSVPLHLYVAFVLRDVGFYVHMAGHWLSYLLLCLVYPAFLIVLSRVRFED